MTSNVAAGLLMFRWTRDELQFFLVHPGGPYFKNKDEGVWSIPKGIPNPGEDLLITAQREFNEETGLLSRPPFYPLGTIKQKGGKVVHGWAFMGEWNPDDGITCNTFEIEWPPKSGRLQTFPEQDRAAWMNFEEAKNHINPQQVPFLEKTIQLQGKISSA